MNSGECLRSKKVPVQTTERQHRAGRKWESAKETHLSTEEAWYSHAYNQTHTHTYFFFHLKVENAIYSTVFFLKRHRRERMNWVTCHAIKRLESHANIQMLFFFETFNYQHAHPPLCFPFAEREKKKNKVLRVLQDKLQFKSNSSHWLSWAKLKLLCECVCVWQIRMCRFGSCRVRDVAKVLFYVLTLCRFSVNLWIPQFRMQRKKANSDTHSEWKMEQATSQRMNESTNVKKKIIE